MTAVGLRVISLVPSSTETLLALGVDVIACTRFCEQPQLPHVGGTKNPDLDAIVGFAPDVVVMDREENRRDDHDALVARGVRVYATCVRTVAEALAVVGELATIAEVTAPTGAPTVAISPVPQRAVRSAFVPIWRRPWMSINAETYGASVLAHIGVEVITGGSTDPYPTVTLSDVAALDPQLVLVPSEPYEFTDAHIDELRTQLASTTVVRVDGRDLFWWGVRTPDALRRLANVIDGA